MQTSWLACYQCATQECKIAKAFNEKLLLENELHSLEIYIDLDCTKLT